MLVVTMVLLSTNKHFSETFQITFRFLFGCLAAQCEIPSHIAQYLLEIVSQRGYRTHFALFSWGMVQVEVRYPFCGGGVSHLHFACSPRLGGKAQKRASGYRTQFFM